MSRFWRIAFAWLLVLALPVQGVAAQTMLLCGPAHHQGSGADEPVMHGHGDVAMDHDHASAHAESTAAGLAPDAGKAPSGKGGHAGKCSVCSSCCNVAAVTTPITAPAVVTPDLPEAAAVVAAQERPIVGGLERPPRLSRT